MDDKRAKKEIKPKFYEEFYNAFTENPNRTTFRELLKNNVGELNILDFKEKLPEYPKIAKAMLGMGNFKGGCLVIGVREEDSGILDYIGIEDLVDKKEVVDGIKKFIPQKLLTGSFDILNLVFVDSEYERLKGKKFQVILIYDKPENIPYVSKAESGNSIKVDTIYARRGTGTVSANYEELQDIINRRIETRYSSSRELNLKNHLEQLKTLYEEIPKTISCSPFFSNLGLAIPQALFGEVKPNPEYPKENFNKFILKMIKEKKNIIAKELGLGEIES